VRYVSFIFLTLFSVAGVFAQGNIRLVLAPDEIPAGEQFTVIVAGKPVSKEQNRMVAIQFPESWKMVKAYAAEDGATESTPVSQYHEMVGYFTKEKGQSVKVFEDRTHVFAEHYDGIAYFFVFTAPNSNSSGNFKACFVERADAGIPDVEVKPKKGKKPKPAKVKNFEWRVVSPDLGSDFSFSEITEKKYTHVLRFVTGWSNTSRALVINDSSHASARLTIRPDLLQHFFNNPFTIEWWMRAVSGEQTLFKFFRPDSLSGLLISANPFGQIAVSRFPMNSDSDIAILSNGTVCDGAWHHITLSMDILGTLRIYTDGQFNDSTLSASVFFHDLSTCSIGAAKTPGHFAIDELRLVERAITSENDIARNIAISARDTISDAFAVFHFDDFGWIARSSIATIIPSRDSLTSPHIESIYFTLDSGANLVEASSPVLLDHALLTVEQSSATKITFGWKATCELGVKRYELQRRIATFGEYEKTLSVQAKRTINPSEEGRAIIARASYSAAEKLPQLAHDIDLYYRLAIIGNHDSVLYYTEPVKLEFGGARDVFVEQNKPNPFNPKTTIAFRLVKSTNVNVTVYDIIGREVTVLHDGKLSAGRHSIDIDATDWPGGIYFYKVKTAKTIVTKKMVLAK
jgi:hypothetical protein